MFQCTGFGDCKMVFTRSEHLARHVRKHTGERPFQCHCGRAFSRLDNVRQHAGTVHAEQADKNAATIAALVHLHNALSATSAASQVEMGMVVKELAEGTTSTNPPRPKKESAVKKPKSAKALAAQAAKAAAAAAKGSGKVKLEVGGHMGSFPKMGDAQMVAGPSSVRGMQDAGQYQHSYHPYYQSGPPVVPPSTLAHPYQQQQHHPYANHFSQPPPPLNYYAPPPEQQAYPLLPPRPSSPPSGASYVQPPPNPAYSSHPPPPHSHHSHSQSMGSHSTSPGGSPPHRGGMRAVPPHPSVVDPQRYYGGGGGGPAQVVYGNGGKSSISNSMLSDQQQVLHHQDQQMQHHQQQQQQQQQQRREQHHHQLQQQHQQQQQQHQQQQQQQQQQPPPQQQQQASGAQTNSPTRPTLPSVNELLAPVYDRPLSYKEPPSFKEPTYYDTANPPAVPATNGANVNRSVPDIKPTFVLSPNGNGTMGMQGEYNYGGFEGFRSGSVEQISPTLSNSPNNYPPQHLPQHHRQHPQHPTDDPSSHYPNYSLSVPPYHQSRQQFQLPTPAQTYSLPPLVPIRSNSSTSIPGGSGDWGTPRGWFGVKEERPPQDPSRGAPVWLSVDPTLDPTEDGTGGHVRSVSHGAPMGCGVVSEGKKRSRTTEDAEFGGGDWKRIYSGAAGDGTAV